MNLKKFIPHSGWPKRVLSLTRSTRLSSAASIKELSCFALQAMEIEAIEQALEQKRFLKVRMGVADQEGTSSIIYYQKDKNLIALDPWLDTNFQHSDKNFVPDNQQLIILTIPAYDKELEIALYFQGEVHDQQAKTWVCEIIHSRWLAQEDNESTLHFNDNNAPLVKLLLGSGREINASVKELNASKLLTSSFKALPYNCLFRSISIEIFLSHQFKLKLPCRVTAQYPQKTPHLHYLISLQIEALSAEKRDQLNAFYCAVEAQTQELSDLNV